MATLVSTGQITIVDNNDAKPITAFVVGSGAATQQIFTKDESTQSYIPDWTVNNLTLTAKVYVGSTTDIASQLSNRKWSTSIGGTSLGSNTTYVINTNVLTTVSPTLTYYFEGDYTDAVTSLTTHVIAQITINQVQTGTNAVFIRVDGKTVIEQATGSTKNNITLAANLMRAAGVDDTGITYQWFASPFAAADQIDGNYTSVTSKYGFMDTAAYNAGTNTGTIGQLKTGAGGTSAAITTVNIPDGGWSDIKAITIDESAINSIGYYLVKAKDSLGTIYQQYFTVNDVSDPYIVNILSSSGDKLQNGQGSTTLTPDVYYGATKLSTLTGWSFTWYLYDKNGNRGGFVDTAKISTAGGATISANTTGTSATFTYSGTAYAFAAGDIIKCVKPDLTAYYYEVASSTGNVITIRTPSTNTFLNFTNYPAPAATTDFVNGKLFGCTTSGTRTTSAASTITLTGDDVDVKSRIMIEANRP